MEVRRRRVQVEKGRKPQLLLSRGYFFSGIVRSMDEGSSEFIALLKILFIRRQVFFQSVFALNFLHRGYQDWTLFFFI